MNENSYSLDSIKRLAVGMILGAVVDINLAETESNYIEYKNPYNKESRKNQSEKMERDAKHFLIGGDAEFLIDATLLKIDISCIKKYVKKL